MIRVIKYSFILFSLSISFASCKKSFLDVPVQGQESPSLDPTFALDLVTGAYNSLITPDPRNSSGFSGYDIHGIMFITVTNIISDDADKGSFASDQPDCESIDNFDITPANSYIEPLWSGYYAGISRTNQAIAALAVAALPDTIIKVRTAEMRFIRAYYYFNLVRMFGGVPIVLKVPSGPRDTDSSFFYRASDSDVYNKAIIPDLQYGINNLPLKNQTDIGRISKGAAETMLAKVYMYTKNWQQCYDLTQDVINSGQYQLMPDYSILWRQAGDNSAESIFEVETGIYGAADNGIPEYCEFQGPRQDNGVGNPTTPWNNPLFWNPTNDGGFGFCTPTQDLVNAYEPGDLRKAPTIIDLPASSPPDTLFDGFIVPTLIGIHTYFNYKAYHSEKRNNQIEVFYGNRGLKQKNLHILRYAEVLLMNAEAATHLGKDAMTPLAEVRTRAGLTTVSATIDDIWKERRVELAMEHDRFWDLVRQGRAAQVMQASGKTGFLAGRNELLPIPSIEIALSGGRLQQNPKY